MLYVLLVVVDHSGFSNCDTFGGVFLVGLSLWGEVLSVVSQKWIPVPTALFTYVWPIFGFEKQLRGLEGWKLVATVVCVPFSLSLSLFL